MIFKLAILWTCCYVTSVAANLNIFLEQQEVRRLLGLNAELYYVREGVINEYALNFVVPVSAHMHDLHFSWQAFGDRLVPYSATVEVIANPTPGEVPMEVPTLNISAKGYIPAKLQVFRLRFHCTGRANSETDVILHMNVTLPHNRKFNNVTQLKFKRKKICLKETSKDHVTLEAESLLISSSETIYIATGTAAALALILLILTSLLYLRKRKNQEPHYDVPAYSSDQSSYRTVRKNSMGSNSYATIDSFNKNSTSVTRASDPSRLDSPENARRSVHQETAAYQVPEFSFTSPAARHHILAKGNYYPVKKSLASLQSNGGAVVEKPVNMPAVPRYRLVLRNLLQEGTFGQIYTGLYLHPATCKEVQVIVKTVTEQSSAAQKQMLLQEGLKFSGLRHLHLLSAMAWCIDANHEAPIVIYPWVTHGNLKRFLVGQRSTGELERRPLLTQDVVDMAIQITLALLFLHRQRIFHKDVAARNCVVDEQLRVKLTDPALSRDLFPNDYHCLGDNENRPIKWMSLECLERREFTSASDVWSFGVLIWELTTLAQQPYAEIDPFEMEAYLKEDYRLAQPLNCPDELFAIMACCWMPDPQARPTLAQLLACLQDFQTALGRFI